MSGMNDNVDSVVRLPCKKCGSNDGRWHTFMHGGRDKYYYWVCKCGRNHGHARTKAGARDTWNEINQPNTEHSGEAR